MKEKVRIYKSYIFGGVFSVALLLFIQAKPVDSYFEISKNLEIFVNIFKELDGFYVDKIEPGKLVKTGIDAMLNELDPYTNYITESDIEDYEFSTTGKYGGIGAMMRKKGEQVYIGDIYENSPSQKAGLHTGDQILSVDNKSVSGKSIEDISVLLKGAPGTSLSIKVKDAFSGEEITKVLTRGEIEVSSVPYAALIGKEKNIAYAKLTQFTMGCSKQLKSNLDSLKKVNPQLKGVILDLRSNPGGLLEEAVSICNLFVDKGQLVVVTRGKIKEMVKEYKTTSSAWDTKIPLTILVNGYSASASEIVAGTMQDLDRGVIIGSQSFGKGLVQVTKDLGYNARLKLTVAKYYTPSGRCIQAIDYSHRNVDGNANKLPDSLKKAYVTKSGRKVLSGGGIAPDIAIEDAPSSKLAAVLYNKHFIFDYATLYAKSHRTIASSANFQLSEAEFSDFTRYLQDKDYSYKTATEVALDSLKQLAIKENYFDAIKGEYAALEGKLSHDKQKDLLKNKSEIKQMLENEIASRYYFLRGRIAQGLQYDNEVIKANAILEDKTSYTGLLQAKK